MVAVALIFGRLTASDYEDNIASNPIIDLLRSKIICVEDTQFSQDYLDPNKRSIANALTIEFSDGGKLDEVVCEYPIGHKRRRSEGILPLMEKFKLNLARVYKQNQADHILQIVNDKDQFHKLGVNEFMDLLCTV
jgi:2-methylcitrate dehydratase